MININIDDFVKLEIKIGEIVFAERIEGSEKLLKLSVDMGEENPRQILSGIAKYYNSPADLIGTKCAFASNLEARNIMGMESQGMILAVSGDDYFSLLEVNKAVPPGSKIK